MSHSPRALRGLFATLAAAALLAACGESPTGNSASSNTALSPTAKSGPSAVARPFGCTATIVGSCNGEPGQTPPNQTAAVEVLQVCKVYPAGTGPTVTVNLDVTSPETPNTASQDGKYHLSYQIPANTCRVLWSNGEIKGTDAQGQPILRLADSYTISEVVPQGYTATTTDQMIQATDTPIRLHQTYATTTTTTSINTASGIIGGYQVPGHTITFTNSLPAVVLGSVGDHVFADLNGNGAQDAGEPNLQGVTVTLNTGATTTTDANGNYVFTSLPLATYTTTVTVPAGYTPYGGPTRSGAIDAGNPTNNTLDFPLVPVSTLSGRVWNDLSHDGVQDAGEPDITGVTLTLSQNGSPIAVSSPVGTGSYSFASLTPGIYNVCVTAGVPTGFTQTFDRDGLATPDCATVTLGATAITNVDFGYTPPRFTLSGVVWNDVDGNGLLNGEPGIGNVGLTLNGTPVPATANDGSYVESNLLAGSYTVCTTTGIPAGDTQTYDLDFPLTPNCATVQVGPNSPANVNFGYKPPRFTISGTVVNDVNNSASNDAGDIGLDGVAIKLNGTLNTTTANGGAYAIGNLLAGSYTVCTGTGVPAGYTQTFDATAPMNDGCATVTVGPSQANVDFGYIAPPRYSIAGTVVNDVNNSGTKDGGDIGLDGVAITINGAPATTTANGGAYAIGNLLAGTYNICTTTGIPAGFTQTFDRDGLVSPNCASVTVGPSVTNADFGYKAPRFSITGTVWTDLNSNGVIEGGETPLNGVTVTINGAGGVVTANGGQYAFGNLLAGTYTICTTTGIPSGYTQTYDADGIATANCAKITVGPNQVANFGYKPPAPRYSLSGTVWNDANLNALNDNGELGIGGVAMTITNPSGTTTTANSGSYSFTNLLAGTYTVCTTTGIPAGYAETYDKDGLQTPNCTTVSLVGNTTGIDFGYGAPRGTKACTYTQGYWKNHEDVWPAPYSPTAQWMTPQKKVVGLTWDDLFGTPPKGGNSYVQVAHQWMAAKLNQTQGAPMSASLLSTLNQTEAWLLANTPTNGSLPSIKSAQADAWGSTLDDWNNGNSGTPHCS